MSDEIGLDRYFQRIGFTGPAEPDLATLTRLHAAHVDAIPFEGLDPFFRRPVRLDLASLQEKLVDSRRGGYCFEQNGLFKAALDAIGFNTTGLAGRVLWMSPPGSPLGPRDHMVIKVDLAEGDYLADVGFGACVMDAPIELKTGIEQRTSMGAFKLTEKDGRFHLEAKQPEGWRTMYAFDMEPQIQADYELGSYFTSTSPKTPFPHVVIMERVSPDRRYKLINRRFIAESRDGELVETRELETPDELEAVIENTFGVTSPGPIEEMFARTGAP
jgi:N-hydroxyarylamine O-acetyltransferase